MRRTFDDPDAPYHALRRAFVQQAATAVHPSAPRPRGDHGREGGGGSGSVHAGRVSPERPWMTSRVGRMAWYQES